MLAFWKERAWFLVAILATAAVLLPLWMVEPRPGEVAFCAECAGQRETAVWGLRGTGFTLFRRAQETPTAVSAALLRTRLVGPHVHRWLEPRTVRNPLNPYGRPVVQSLGFLNTPLVAGLLGNLGDWADPTAAQNGKELLLRPEYSYLVNQVLRFHCFPPHGFRDRVAFLSWWTQNGFPVLTQLREETEPD